MEIDLREIYACKLDFSCAQVRGYGKKNVKLKESL